MAERKKATKKTKARPGTKTPPAPKKKAAARKKVRAKKPASGAVGRKPVIAAKPTPKRVASPAPGTTPTPPPPPVAAGEVTADEVLLTHVMALKPRTHVGFKPSAFVEAKRALAEARYASIEAAARAVAEKAIEISNESSPRDPFSRR